MAWEGPVTWGDLVAQLLCWGLALSGMGASHGVTLLGLWWFRAGICAGAERGVPAPLPPSASRGGSASRAPNRLLLSGETRPSGCSPRFPHVAPSVPLSSVGSTAHPGPGAAPTRTPIPRWGNRRELCLKKSPFPSSLCQTLACVS